MYIRAVFGLFVFLGGGDEAVNDCISVLVFTVCKFIMFCECMLFHILLSLSLILHQSARLCFHC